MEQRGRILSKITCQCGNVISSSDSDDSGHWLVDRELLGILFELLARGELDESALQMISDGDHLFPCDNCGRLLLEDSSTGRAKFYVPASIPRVRVDPDDRDGLGRIRLRNEHSLEVIKREKLVLTGGPTVIAYWPGGETQGRVFAAVGDDGEFIPNEWALTEG